MIPVANPGKRPLIGVGKPITAPRRLIVRSTRGARPYPNAGIGLVYGPDGLLGVDLDFLEPAVAARGEAIVREALGQSDCLRIGRSPKASTPVPRGTGLKRAGQGLRRIRAFQYVRPDSSLRNPSRTQAGHITGPASRPKTSARATCLSSTRPR